MVYSNTTVYGEMTWYFWSLAYFCFFEALNDAFEEKIFQGLILHPITDTDSMQGNAAQIFESGNIFKQCL